MKKLAYCLLLVMLIVFAAQADAAVKSTKTAKAKQVQKSVKVKSSGKNIILTKENYEKIFDKIYDYKDVTSEEADGFVSYVLAGVIAESVNNVPLPFIGMTVGQAINEGKILKKKDEEEAKPLVLGCPTKDLVLTEENKSKMFASISHYMDITTEEARLFRDGMMGSAFATYVTNKQQSTIGKTVGQVIEEERIYEKKHKTKGKK